MTIKKKYFINEDGNIMQVFSPFAISITFSTLKSEIVVHMIDIKYDCRLFKPQEEGARV